MIFLGDFNINNYDKFQRGRACHKGELHPSARLNEANVLKIREMASAGVKGATIARKYGVDPGTIYAIVNRKSWTHI